MNSGQEAIIGGDSILDKGTKKNIKLNRHGWIITGQSSYWEFMAQEASYGHPASEGCNLIGYQAVGDQSEMGQGKLLTGQEN